MIIQQINLYQDSLKAKPPNTGLYVAVAIAALVLISVGVLDGYLTHQLRIERAQVEQKRTALTAVQERIKRLETAAAKQEVAHSIVVELEQWQQKVTEATATIELLTHNSSDSAGGFAAYFQALASQPVAGVWLTELHFSAERQNIRLIGNTFKSDKIPNFLQNLQQQSAFQGLAFSQLQVTATEQDPKLMRFTLDTQPEIVKKDHVK